MVSGPSRTQAEQDVQNLTRKLKLLETDLEQSEDKAQDSDKKLRVAEAQVEELQREKKQLENQIGILESELSHTTLLPCMCVRFVWHRFWEVNVYWHPLG